MGVNPIRARRRDANDLHMSLPDATIGEMSLEIPLRRRIYVSLSRNIQILLILCMKLRVPAKRENTFYIRRKRNMKFKISKKIVSWLFCMMLIVAMAFTTIGCDTKKEGDTEQPQTENVQGSEEQPQTEDVQEPEDSSATVLGEGQKMFMFTVTDKDGNETNFEIHTDKETVGEALLELELIEGEPGDYGLYVKKVNGITADYDVDQTYWAFYVNGEYATAGVDATTIEDGVTYAFKVEK